MMRIVRFDDSLPVLASTVVEMMGLEVFQAGTVLRDAVGCLAFFADRPLDPQTVTQLSLRLRDKLGAYARPDRVVVSSEEFGSHAVRVDASALVVSVAGLRVRLLDRRLVGADWLRSPAPPAPPPPRFVFASLKGGVGRSTALTVSAAHLAAQGRRVLAVDLDMEAPGLGSLLLTRDTLPEFGVIDALVENGISGLDEAFYADLTSPSVIADKGGRIDVLPAFGLRSLRNPADVLAKLARAYTEDLRPDGTCATILDQVSTLIDQFADPSRYDAILIDARAGLHETTASAVLGLGAEVLLFGLDEEQTFQGYAVMLAHLGRFSSSHAQVDEWMERLTMVQGKAPADEEQRRNFALRCREMFADAGLGRQFTSVDSIKVVLPGGSFRDVPWDDDMPDEEVLPSDWSFSAPLAVLHDAQFQHFDPLRRRDLVSEGVYRATFGDLIRRIDATLEAIRDQP